MWGLGGVLTAHPALSGPRRGLAPRLVIYALQGGIFFTSYRLVQAVLPAAPSPLSDGGVLAKIPREQRSGSSGLTDDGSRAEAPRRASSAASSQALADWQRAEPHQDPASFADRVLRGPGGLAPTSSLWQTADAGEENGSRSGPPAAVPTHHRAAADPARRSRRRRRPPAAAAPLLLLEEH